jgi:hypothetical protein
MKKIIYWASRLLSDERGEPSSKRFIGIIAGLTLCSGLLINIHTDFPVEAILVNAVAAVCIGGLGLSSADKIWGKKSIKSGDQQINS